MDQFNVFKIKLIFFSQEVCDAYEKTDLNKELLAFGESVAKNPKLDGIIVSIYSNTIDILFLLIYFLHVY